MAAATAAAAVAAAEAGIDPHRQLRDEDADVLAQFSLLGKPRNGHIGSILRARAVLAATEEVEEEARRMEQVERQPQASTRGGGSRQLVTAMRRTRAVVRSAIESGDLAAGTKALRAAQDRLSSAGPWGATCVICGVSQ